MVAGKSGLLMSGIVALNLLCIAILNMVTERHGETNRRARSVLRLVASDIALALALAGSSLPPIISVALIGPKIAKPA